MTPMIDVVFQLLIFFVCTASFSVAEDVLPSRLAPTQGAAPAPVIDPADADLERLVLRGSRVEGQTTWTLNDRPVGTLVPVRAQLRLIAAQMRKVGTSASRLAVVLDVGEGVPLGDAIDVYDVCRLEGFERIQFAAKAGDMTSDQPAP